MNRIHRMVRETRWKRVQGRAAVCRRRAAGLPKHVFQRVSRTNRRFLTGGLNWAGRAGLDYTGRAGLAGSAFYSATSSSIPIRAHGQTIITVISYPSQRRRGSGKSRALEIHPCVPTMCRIRIRLCARLARRGVWNPVSLRQLF